MGRKAWTVQTCMAVFILTVSASSAGSQQPLIQAIGNGEVNWSEQVIRATGSGVPNLEVPSAAARIGAERAAKVDALRNILETLKGVRIDSQTLVVNAMTQSDVIRTQVQGVIRGARVVDKRYTPDGAVEVTVEIPMAGPLAQALLPPTAFGSQSVPKTGDPVYTGIVIDSRGLNLHPAMAPKILDEDGREVYGSAFVSQEWATKYGILGYVKDLDAAQKNDRVAANPLLIKAVKVTGAGESDIVISSSDAQGLRDMTKNLSFLEQCRALAVVD